MAGISLRERTLIGELWQMGMKDSQIAERLGLKQTTVRKWRQRWVKEGREGMVSQMGRPKCGALSSFPAEMLVQLKNWREAHSGWGPKPCGPSCADTLTGAGRHCPAERPSGVGCMKRGWPAPIKNMRTCRKSFRQ